MGVVLSFPGTWLFYRLGFVLLGCGIVYTLCGVIDIAERMSRKRGHRAKLLGPPWWHILVAACVIYLGIAIGLNQWEAFVGKNAGIVWLLYAPVVVVPVLRVGIRYAFPIRLTRGTPTSSVAEERYKNDDHRRTDNRMIAASQVNASVRGGSGAARIAEGDKDADCR